MYTLVQNSVYDKFPGHKIKLPLMKIHGFKIIENQLNVTIFIELNKLFKIKITDLVIPNACNIIRSLEDFISNKIQNKQIHWQF